MITRICKISRINPYFGDPSNSKVESSPLLLIYMLNLMNGEETLKHTCAYRINKEKG